MVNLCGESSSRLLFTDGRNAVSIDKITNIVEDVADIAVLSAYPEWREPDSEPTQAQIDLATGALADLEIHVVTAAGRMYTIPKGAQAEAKKALEWRKEHKRGGTPVGLNTARTLARGGQIGIEKIRHIAKYFPRHEVDKKGKGWKPGQDNFPSNGRIAWALWGGDVAWRWAQAIVERENKRKKSMSAGGFIDDYETPGHNADLNAFKLAYEMGEENAPEFVARVGADENIDRLYKIDLDGTVFVWDDGGWDSLGHVDHDISTMDRALDDPYDTSDKRHILIDADSAFIISAHLQAKPFSSISVYDLDEEEAALVLAAADDIDWVAADYALAAAGDAPEGAVEAGDGQYTPKERSEKARRQVRDKTGRFAQSGSRVVIGGDASKTGTITSLRPDTDSVIVKMDSGESVEVAGTDTQREDSVQPMTVGPGVGDSDLDTSGILAQPRAPMDKPDAYIPGGLPGLTPKDLDTVISNFPAWVQSQRGAQKPAAPTSEFKPKDPGYNKKPAEADDFQKNIESLRGRPIYDDAHQHPMLKDFFKKKKNEVWFNPITSAAEQGKEKEDDTVEDLTPENSDVQPMYMAIVSPDDPRAVFDLIAIVPASKKSNTPMTYVRKEGKWSRDEKILADLKSATPPPVVPLHGDVYKDVLSQVDGGVRASGEFILAEPVYEIFGAKKTKKPKLVITDKDFVAQSLEAAGILVAEEKDLADALVEIAEKHGKFNEDKTGIWAGYVPAEENEIQEMGVTCANCVLYEGGTSCKILANDVEPLARCRFAVIPDGVVKSPTTSSALVAKGGLDRNRGKAEKLRRYWLYGKGALKIRWNTPGDWTRCFRHLAKYMGPRAKGYCALRHKEATGMWTGDKMHRKMYGRKGSRNFSINDVVSSEDYYMRASLSAHAEAAREKMRSLTATGAYKINENTVEQGSKFSIPLVIPEGVESGDGRKFKKEAISLRELPLPLLWQIKTADGHNGSVVVGRIDHMERTEDGIGNATGVFDTGAYGKEAERMVREGFMRGVSADLDMFEASEDQEDAENSGTKEDGKIGGNKLTITQARVMAVTIVPKPAFEQCKIYIEDQASGTQEEETVFQDGEYVEELDITPVEAEAIVACGSIAASIPVVPPATWFTNPNLDKPTPLTVDENGRVFGHIAAWHVDHIGMSHGVRAPRSRTNYAYFHTGVVRTDDNKDVPVGQLTLAGGHAPLEASARDAVKHYDDTASAIADVHAGEDSYGIWVAGALRPGTTPEQVRVFRASAPSGDWRPIKGHLELVAVCQVNVPGFPIARARVASGQVYALVAAGASILAKMKSDPLIELEQRVAALETSGNSALVARATEMREKFTAAKEEVDAELSTRAAAAATRFASIRGIEYDELGYISRETRQKLAAEKKALPDGSFPIRNEGELKDAVQAFGRAKKSKRAAVRRHIMRRARGMGRSDLIPEEWKNLSIADDIDFEIIDDMRSRVASAQAEAEFADISTEARERLAKEGKALPDGSYPIRNASDLENAIKAYGRSKPGDRAKVRRHIMKRARALGKADMIPEKWKSASAMEEDVLDLRARVASAKEGLLAGETETPSSEALLAAPEVEAKYVSGVNQPRDAAGKFRQVLARLKGDLGTSGLDDVVKKIEETENLDDAGNYKAAAASAQELLKILDRLDSGSLNPQALENIRSTTRELGSVISNLPLPFGSEAQKVRYSDLPPVLRDLIDSMMDRVEKKIGKEDAAEATQKLRQYKAGGDAYSQEEVSSDLSKLLRLLT
jgi:hypothetical protein